MIHQYKNNGYNIVLDVNSGSVHVVDDVAYDVIGLYETTGKTELTEKICEKYKAQNITEDDLRELYEDLEAMREAGTLFSEDEYRDGVIDFKQRQTVVKALCLHIAHACNLSCEYCFAGDGEYSGARSLMSAEVGKKALDFLVKNSGNRKNLEVDFFGGEPLLNFDVVKELVAYGRSLEGKYDKHFRFTLTTNGILLDDDIIAFANREMDNIVLSIDGRREVHDRMRPAKDGSGSYDRILDKFKRVAESRGQEKYYVRGTFTHYNLDFVEDVLHLADEGFR